MTSSSLLLPLLVCVVLIISNLMYFWKRRNETIGAFVTYIIFFSGIYLLQPIMNVLPWYKPIYDVNVIYDGLIQVMVAVISLTVGIRIAAPLLITLNRERGRVSIPRQQISTQFNQNLIYIYIVLSVIGYFILTPILGQVPTLQAFLVGIAKLLHVGIILGFWTYIKNPRVRVLLLICAFLTLIWPIITITTTGFLATGIGPTIFVLAFVLMRHKAFKRILLFSPIVLFVLMSFISTYFNNRNNLRALVWGGASTNDVLDYTLRAYTEGFTWFNFYESENLTWIDIRLNLTYFTGLAVRNIETGVAQFAGGATINDAFLMLVPRAVWTDKPIQIGGNALASYYTNLQFTPGTTYALGQVMELYINYGTSGVVVGFIILGLCFSLIERRGAAALAEGSYYRFALWVMPVFGLLLVEDNFTTLFATSVSGLLTVFLVNVVLKSQTSGKHRNIQVLTVHKET